MAALIDLPTIEIKIYSKKKLCSLMGYSRKQFNTAIKNLHLDKSVDFENNNSWYLSPKQVKIILHELYC